MTILTHAIATTTPFNLADYSYTPKPSPVDVYLKATSGYAKKFDELSGHFLRQMEIRTRNTDAPRDHVEDCHNLLHGPWKWAIDRFDATVTDADYQAVADLPWDHPRTVAYRTASTAMDAWLAARDQLHVAWMDWSLDLTGTVDIDDPPGPEPVAVAHGHRVPDCDGWCQRGDMCSTPVVERELPGGGKVVTELYADTGEPVTAVVFTDDMKAHSALLRTTDPAQLQALADKFFHLGNDLIRAAHVLEQLHEQEAK